MLTRETVEKVAHLARLKFSEQEFNEQLKQINLIMEMMDTLQEIDTNNIEPLNHVMDICNIFREDEIVNDFTLEEVLANAPEEMNGMFRVPKIV